MHAPVTYLFVPGDRPDRFSKAMSAGADRVILDLEDAVRPDAKPAARAAVVAADLDWARVAIRLNPAGSPFYDDDLAAVAATTAAIVVLPKAESADEVVALGTRIGRPLEIVPQIETARGLALVDALLAAPGVARVAFGHLDFALDLGTATAWDALTLARQTLVWRSRLAGRAAPVDSVTVELDEAAVRRDALAARDLGFDAKLLIHPAQVAPAVAAFAPTTDELAWARRVREAVARGTTGASTLDGRMIDKPVEDAARRILARAGHRTEAAPR